MRFEDPGGRCLDGTGGVPEKNTVFDGFDWRRRRVSCQPRGDQRNYSRQRLDFRSVFA